ncbi:MAG: hypothetical protein AB7Q17_14095 [Phycisphaerae bacterium]
MKTRSIRRTILAFLAAGALASGCATGGSPHACPKCAPVTPTVQKPAPSAPGGAPSANTPAESGGDAGAPTVLGSDWTSTRSSNGAYEVRLRTRPTPLPLNEPFDLDIDVRGVDASVSLGVDAAMPGHGHGMNVTPLVRNLGAGRFVVNGLLFHMPGYWEIYIDLTRGGVTERAQYSVTLD